MVLCCVRNCVMNHNLNEHPKHTEKNKEKNKEKNITNKNVSITFKKIDVRRKVKKSLLSIVVPVFNESEVISLCDKRLNAVSDILSVDVEIIYVNDGSTDNTLQLLKSYRQDNKRISIVDLSRNFGKEIAMTAGLDHAEGDAVIVIDADLQDPPELIPKMISEWQQGYDVVYMKRDNRRGETLMKKITASGFYFIINKMSNVEIPRDVGDYRLLSRRAVDSLNGLRESNRFMKGLFSWLGYKQKEILYHRDERMKGVSKWNYSALFNLAIEGITSFSVAPLKLASVLGVLSLFLVSAFSAWVGVDFFVSDIEPSSMTLLSMGLVFFAGLQMLLLGILGEYVGRMFMETKNRPLYLVNEFQKSEMSVGDKLQNNASFYQQYLS